VTKYFLLSEFNWAPFGGVRMTLNRPGQKTKANFHPTIFGHHLEPQVSSVIPQVSSVIPQVSSVIPQVSSVIPQVSSVIPESVARHILCGNKICAIFSRYIFCTFLAFNTCRSCTISMCFLM
jgi:hypothetical protein